jgi:hypothetical protein
MRLTFGTMGEIYRSEAFQNIEVGFVAEQPLHRPVETNQSFCYFETFCNKSTGIARENKKREIGQILKLSIFDKHLCFLSNFDNFVPNIHFR